MPWEQLIRRLCLVLPEVEEGMVVHHPAYRVNGKAFAILDLPAERSTLAIKVGKPNQGIFLQDPRFSRTPYIGQHGWVTLHLSEQVPEEELAGLIEGSYRLTAPKRLLKQLK